MAYTALKYFSKYIKKFLIVPIFNISSILHF